MAALRAKQQLNPPIVKAARLAAKEASARKYRERNRAMLATKAFVACTVAREQVSCERHHLEQQAVELAMRQRRDLDVVLEGLEPTESDQE
ncbi:hypothetical protein K438DRAFT_1956469 [Mycena galopus ATCC 62051]|nr:hypothetical protein K438DRAFT_1956469 [Mycena galopus ATCC 62051]